MPKTNFHQLSDTTNHAIASVFLGRFTGLIGLSIVAVIAAPLCLGKVDSTIAVVIVAGTAALLALIVGLLWFEPIARLNMRLIAVYVPAVVRERVRTFYVALHSYRMHGRIIAQSVVLSVLVQLLFALYYALTAVALGIDVSVL